MQGMPLRDINHATSAKQALDVSPLPEQVVIGSGQCKQGLVIRHIAGKTLYGLIQVIQQAAMTIITH